MSILVHSSAIPVDSCSIPVDSCPFLQVLVPFLWIPVEWIHSCRNQWGMVKYCISGYTFIINEGAVSWSSCKQEHIVLSTPEAEYVAATHTAKEATWLWNFSFQPPHGTHDTSLQQSVSCCNCYQQQLSCSHKTHQYMLSLYPLCYWQWTPQVNLLSCWWHDSWYSHQSPSESEGKTLCSGTWTPCTDFESCSDLCKVLYLLQ